MAGSNITGRKGITELQFLLCMAEYDIVLRTLLCHWWVPPSPFQFYFLMLTHQGKTITSKCCLDYSLIIFALTDIFLEALPWVDIGREGLAGRRKTQNQRIRYLLLLVI